MFSKVHPSMEKMDSKPSDSKDQNFNISQVLAVGLKL
jgi:hypothetical protein